MREREVVLASALHSHLGPIKPWSSSNRVGLTANEKKESNTARFFRIWLHGIQLTVHMNSFMLKVVAFHLIVVSGFNFTSNCSSKRLVVGGQAVSYKW